MSNSGDMMHVYANSITIDKCLSVQKMFHLAANLILQMNVLKMLELHVNWFSNEVKKTPDWQIWWMTRETKMLTITDANKLQSCTFHDYTWKIKRFYTKV